MSKFVFQLFSDIHFEFSKSYPKIPQSTDYLFLAGDIGKLHIDHYKDFFDYCSKNWKHTFYVLGNHEYYSGTTTYDVLNKKYHDFFESYENVHLLDNSSFELDEYIIIGSTLWSKCNYDDSLNDFKSIKEYNDTKTRKYGLSIETFNKLYDDSAKYLIEEINKTTKKIIVMTHFPPLQGETSDPIYADDDGDIKNYFASNLLLDDKINKENIICWIYGHTHYSNDFYFDKIRMLSNQIGYSDEKCVFDGTGLFQINP